MIVRHLPLADRGPILSMKARAQRILRAGMLMAAGALLAATGGIAAAQTGTRPAADKSGAQPESRVVLELFTSQGCSSCPAADRLLGELSKDPSLIPLSLSVDYWDYIGWKDTLALGGHTARQRGYSKIRGDREVYTPQMVVNGQVHVLGNDRAAIEQAVAAARRTPGALSVPVSLTASGDLLAVSIPEAREGGAPPRGADIWLCPISRTVPVEVERGENRGKIITYHNVVRGWVRLGEWTGEAGRWTMTRADFLARAKGPADAVTVLVQARRQTAGGYPAPGPMLGAATARLP